MYLTGVAIFLVGSALCGVATGMIPLIAARVLQGIGAGGIIPLSMTIIGELYTLKERPRTQALFSGVWGLASIAGPLVGGSSPTTCIGAGCSSSTSRSACSAWW